MGLHYVDAAAAAEAGTALLASAASTAAVFAPSFPAVAAVFSILSLSPFFLLRKSADTAAAPSTAVHISSSKPPRCLPAAAASLLTAAASLLATAASLLTAAAVRTSVSPPVAVAPSLRRGTTATRLGAAAAVLVVCAAAAASASTAPAAAAASYLPDAAISPAAALFSGEGGTPEAGEEEHGRTFGDSPETAAETAEEGTALPGAAAAEVDDAYRRSGAAAYDWYTAGSGPSAAPPPASFREALPALYGVSFLHDFLNYSTAVLWFAAYAALLRRVYVARNIHGLSLQSLFALVWVEVNNVLLIAVLSLYHRKSLNADFFLVDVSSAAVSLLTFLYVFRLFRGSYERERDNFGKQLMRFPPLQSYSKKYYFAVLYVVSLCLAIPMFLLRRSSFGSPTSLPASAASVSAAASLFSSPSVYASPFSASSAAALLSNAAARCTFYVLSFWECFNDTVLALALLPQLCMLYNKRPRKVTSLLATFMALLFFARLCAFFYWMTFPLFHSTYPAGRGIHLVTEALNILLLSDFLYYYLKARFSGEADVALPL